MTSNSQSSGTQPLWPPIVGSAGPPQNFGPPMSMQFLPVGSQQQGQPFIPPGSQQFRPVGQGMPLPNVGPSPQNQQLPFPPSMHQLHQRPGQPGHGPQPSQAIQMPFMQQNRPITSESPQPHQNSQPLSNHMPGVGGSGMPPSSYTFTPSPYGQPQNNMNASSHYQPISQMHTGVAPAGGQPWLPSGPVATAMQGQQSSVTAAAVPATNVQPNPSIQLSSDWQEHTSNDGRRYYYNKKTKQSSWEKPVELMTPIERADASTDWKEFINSDGRKYYYNKVTKLSKWTIPEELKLAREQAEREASHGIQSESAAVSQPQVSLSIPLPEASSIPSSAPSGTTTIPVPVTPIVAVANQPTVAASGSPSLPVLSSVLSTNAAGVQSPVAAVATLSDSISRNGGVPVTTTPPTSTSDIASSLDGGASVQDLEEARKGMAVAGKINVTPSEEKAVEEETLVYANKQEAKIAFKALLESANVESDSNWEQAMRVIINDKRYGALKTLGERKQAFNEYLGQRKKQEAEERRVRQKKAREEFAKMLEESKELTSSTRWPKAMTMFEDDERYKAVDRARDREDIFENFTLDLQKKEKAKAQEEHKRNIMEYKQFLESCDFIKPSSQWRKVQDRLEDDERCSRLEKVDRLDIFQEYIRELEKEEEEQKKIQKEQLRRAERKNRDEFRKLMEEHVAAGDLTAKTHWRVYCMKVKDLPAYMAVSSNTSGSTPKDLFEDVAEELEKQYRDDKTRVKDAMKLGKIAMSSASTYEEFKAAIAEDLNFVSDINLQLVFEELLERIKEKEEKEAKKRQRLADDFSDLLRSIKDITTSSNWEDCKPLLEDSQEYRSIAEESDKKALFEDYIRHLQEKAKEKERKREEEKAKKEKEKDDKEKRKEKDRKEKERERDWDKERERSKKDDTESDTVDASDAKEERKRDKDKDRKHRKRHQSGADDMSSEKEEKDDSKKSRRHSSSRKKSRKHAYTPDSDSEGGHKRHRKDHRDGSRRNGTHEELEDGELGEDGEIRTNKGQP
ncbi:hypothetical protein MKX01_019441 [Papaver californicum]|nr:hypothetical protein MKX01_019441 [Papaver californicum]